MDQLQRKSNYIVLLVLAVCPFNAVHSQERGDPTSDSAVAETRFIRLDKNGDGKLQVSEAPNAAIHRRFDANKDGVVTLEEAKVALSNLQRSASVKDVSYGPHEANVYDIYMPEEPKEASVMIYVHGGGWKTGDKKRVGEKAKWFTQKGWIFISANYRLIPDGKHPNNVDDIAACFSHVHNQISAQGGNPDSIYLMGHSAGCHLVSLVATDESRLKKYGKELSMIKGVIALDTGSFDIPDSIEQNRRFGKSLKKVFGDSESSQKNASPIHHIAKGKNIPPFFVVYTRGLTKTRVNPQRVTASKAFLKD